MDVILLEPIHGLGERGSRVSVSRGFARNYLLPRRLAVLASGAGEAVFKEELRVRSRRDDTKRSAAEQVKASLDGLEVLIRAQASDEGKLYGSVGANEIVGALAELGREVDRKAIMLNEPIKMVGEYPTQVRLLSDVLADVHVKVERSDA